VSNQVLELAEEIKQKGRRSALELPPLLQKAEQMAQDESQAPLNRALAWRAAGNAHRMLNQFQSALADYEAAIGIQESLDEPLELGRTLHARIVPLFLLSRFEELFVCAARARGLFEQIGDRRGLARLDVNLANAFHRLDRHHEALEHARRALPILEELSDSEGFLAASIDSAVALTAMHEFEEAERYYRSALKMAAGLEMTAWVLLSRYNLAYLRYLDGDTSEALGELAALRKEFTDANDEWHVCLCWLDEAEALLEIGELDASIQAARQAKALGQKLGLNSETGKALLFEAAAQLRLERKHEADELLREAILRFEAERNQVWTAVSRLQTALLRGESGERAALSEAVSARALLEGCRLPHRLALADIVVGRIQRSFGDTESAMESLESGRRLARQSRSQWMQFHACYELAVTLTLNGDPLSDTLFRDAEAMLDSLWDRLGSDDLKLAFLADRENVYTHLMRSAARKSPLSAFDLSEKARSRVMRERLINDELRSSAMGAPSRLSTDETVIEYFITGDDLCIFVIDSEDIQCIYRSGVVARLTSEWLQLDRHLSSCSVKWEKLRSVQHHLLGTALEHLYQLHAELIAPLGPGLRQSIVFVPHGFLHDVPFHALYDGVQFLIDKHHVSYSPSACLYCAPVEMTEAAGPVFVGFSGSRAISIANEIEEAATHFDNAEILINPSLEDLHRVFTVARSLVHIAGHAGVDFVGGKLSWIETPEGRLTSRELADMQIRANTLVVTGCQTARRLIKPGDEWLGLMRAFYMAGASTIVSAFWEIRDESARRFASEFYKEFDGTNAASALRKAACVIRARQGHPYFWAGFGAFTRKSNLAPRLAHSSGHHTGTIGVDC
jgi:CHAT domain-containing protein/tetratricopeptide (TPR) repeat protein